MFIRLRNISKRIFNEFPVTVNDLINSHWDCLRARGSPVDEILANAADTELFDNEAHFRICTKLIYGETVKIGENNFDIIYKFGDFFKINEIYSEVKMWIDKELTYENFWKVYIKLRSLNAKTEFFVNGICRHLSNDNDNFLACTKDLFEDSSVETIASAVELLLVPEVVHLDAVINARMIPVVSYLASNMKERHLRGSFTTAEVRCLGIVNSFIVTYIEWYGSINDRDSYIQHLNGFPLPRGCLKTMIRTIISFIKARFPRDFDTRLSEMDQLTKSLDTIKAFMDSAKDVIHPCVVAEIALKWVRSTDLRDQATCNVKGIIKALLENLKESSAQWYNSVCNDERYQSFIKDHLGLPLRTKSYYPQVLDDKGIKTLIECIIEGNGVEREFNVQLYSGESVRGFKYEDGKCPPYGDIADHWFIKTAFRHVSFIVDSKVDAIVAINASQCISLCCVPAPANPNTLQ